MNTKQEVEKIVKILNDKNYKTKADYIKQSELEGATGGEIFDILISKLLEIKKNDSKIYDFIRIPSEKILEYAESIGRL